VLSSSGKTYGAQFPHIALRRFESRVYLVGLEYAESGRIALLEARLLSGEGITKACSIKDPDR